MHRFFNIYCFAFFVFPLFTRAQQQYVFQHLTTKDGLASDITKFIFQDSKGFYWIGYDNGFQKFDGKTFTTIPFKNKYVFAQVLDEMPFAPIEDKAGTVYISNQGSVYAFHLMGRVDTIQVFDNPNESLSSFVNACKDDADNIWLSTNSNLYRYDKTNNKCIRWLALGKHKIIGTPTGLVYESGTKCLWLSRDNNVFCIDPNSKKITQPFLSNHLDKTDPAPDMNFTGLWKDSKHNLWLGSWNGFIYKYNTVSLSKEVFDISSSKSSSFPGIMISCIEDRQQKIWIGCINGGLYEYDGPANKLYEIRSNNNMPFALHYDYSVYPLYQDKEGNIWAGTDRGINIFNPYLRHFLNIDENILGESFQKPDITRIFQAKSNDIFVGTWGKGWLLFDSGLTLKKQFADSSMSVSRGAEKRRNFVWCFAEDLTGKIWIGYQHGLVGIFNPLNQLIKYIDVPGFNKQTVLAINCDGQGNIWFGLHSGLLGKWNVSDQQFYTYPHPPQKLDYPAEISDLLIDRKGYVWIASRGNGFYCFDPATEKYIAHYRNDGENSVFDNWVNALTRINDSVIGISNKFKGFLLFNQTQQTFTAYTERNGQKINDVFGIAKDKEDNTWMATKHGLFRMNKQDRKIISFDEDDGLFHKIFQGNFVPLAGGRMVVPAETGLVVFSPDKINNVPVPPDVTITGFSIFSKSIHIDSALQEGKAIQLKHDQNFITVSFSSISFSGRNSTQYYYMLQGIDQDWVSTFSQHTVNYTGLPPGRYIFKVRCENRDGSSSKNITTLPFFISPPWWGTWWAYILYILGIGGIGYAVYSNRIRQIRERQTAQIQLMVATQEEERKRISRDLHDDVGTKLSALKLFLSALNEKAGDTGNPEIKRLAGSSEQFVLETISDVRGLLLNLSPSVLEEFGYITAVEGLIDKINETAHIHFSLGVFGITHRLNKEHELALFRITQELINNVLKHSEAKNVSLQIGKRDSKIILMVEDDGIGFAITPNLKGYGLHNLDARTKLLHGTLSIDSLPGRGTSVLIEIPDNLITAHEV